MQSYWLHGVAILGCLATPIPRFALADDDVDAIIDGIVARSKAIYSIKVGYQYESTVHVRDHVVAEEQRSQILTVVGHDWILRYPDSTHFRMNRNRASVTYYEPSVADLRDRALHLEDGVPLRALVAEHASHAVSRLGTLWFDSQVQFIDEHRSKVQRKPDSRVHGVPTQVLQWRLDREDIPQALVVLPGAVVRSGKAILRIYAAKELGWATPRVEYLTHRGRLLRRFDSEQFDEISQGLYFPFSATIEMRAGAEVTKSRFAIHSIDYANRPVPSSEFQIDVPAGTRIRDSRPGVAAATFTLQNPNQIKGLNAALGQGTARMKSISPATYLVLINVGVVLLGAILWNYIRCQKRASGSN